ncbi:MAG: hypothetical protein KDC18_13675 [Alphaproteobacteria bacterium]|nr:hypothetical protein [Alphaproteobacteria bacterium]MCB9929285.1 hypothetical protein [Alphaproteobacteria bacterium]
MPSYANPFVYALVGVFCLLAAVFAFRPMKRLFGGRPAAAGGSISVAAEMAVVAWMALLIVGISLVANALL